MKKGLVLLVFCMLIVFSALPAWAGGVYQLSTGDNWIEAERYTNSATGNWVITNDSAASNGQYMYLNTTARDVATDVMEYTFNINYSGTIYVWYRGIKSPSSSDGIYIQMDNGTKTLGKLDMSSWGWKLDNDATYTITAGQHTFRIYNRFEKDKIDKILITTNSGTTPSGLGGAALPAPGGGSTPTPTPTVVPGTPTPTPIVTPTPTTPPGTLTYPADLLNLTNWKLTLPIGSGTSPTEIKQPQLDTYSIDPYFLLNPNKDGVIFQAHCGGVTTSNSGYPRSELREMTDSGQTNASWSTSSGTHTMYIRQAITHLPVVKPHVVAGQIHGSSDDVIVIRLEGTKLFVDHNGTAGPTITTNYQLGTVFTVKFVASGGHIKIYYNDSATPVDDYTKSASGCYFKAGCYTQSNTSKGDSASAYGQVIIYDVWVTHQ